MGFDCTDPEEVINFFCDIWLSTIRGRKEGGGGSLVYKKPNNWSHFFGVRFYKSGSSLFTTKNDKHLEN